MFLTLETLNEKNACATGILWFKRYFPEGGELKDIIAHKYVPVDFLHWGYNNLPANSEERELCRTKLNIVCGFPQTIFNSQNILNSSNVSHSKNIENSDYIFISKFVKDSNIVHSSKNVKNSHHIFNSKDITNCAKVYISNNIANSDNVINSSNISNSCSIAQGDKVNNSMCVINSNNIDSSYFISESNNLTKCLFCHGIESQELCMFNKPIPEQEFDMYYRELLQYMELWEMNFITNWYKITDGALEFPLVNNRIDFFQNLPQEFLNWIKALPNYDADLFAQITLI